MMGSFSPFPFPFLLMYLVYTISRDMHPYIMIYAKNISIFITDISDGYA